MYYPIDEKTAKRAHDMMSMSDYPEGRATKKYKAAVDKAAAITAKKKASVSQYYHEKLDALLDKYARRLAEWTNAYNRNGASCPSVMICGASNFPIRKKEKQNAREERLWSEYKEIQSIIDKIKSIGTGAVDLADPHAREILTDQLKALTKRLDNSKALNAWYRKNHTFEGFPGLSASESSRLSAEWAETRERCPWVNKPVPDFELASLRGKIKRVQARLADLDALQSQKSAEAEEHNGIKIVRNAELNRLQIFFPDKPDEETREKLKSNGFRWAPSVGAWQRQLTANAERAARKVFED